VSALVVIALSAGGARSVRAQIVPTAAGRGWDEILTTQRSGSQLTAFAVDLADPTRLYAGTEDGSILVSEDGGITFDERRLNTRGVVAQSVAPTTVIDSLNAPPGVLGVRTPQTGLWVDPPYAHPPIGRVDIPGFDLFDWHRPNFVFAGDVYGSSMYGTPSLLWQLSAQREREVDPVVHLISCPGSPFPLIALTRSTVQVSDDHGATFLTTLSAGTSELRVGRCDLSRPGVPRVVVGTSLGTFESLDGGLTFMPFASADAERGVGALTIAPDGTVYVGGWLFAFRADPSGQLSAIYDFLDPSAPLTPINTVYPVPSGAVFVGSDDGLRVVRDGRLSVVAPDLFEMMSVRDLMYALDDEGRHTIYAVVQRCIRPGIRTTCRDSRVFESTDDGATWNEVLEGGTRHPFLLTMVDRERHTVYAVSSNSVFTRRLSGERAGDDAPVDVESQRWARAQLAASPRLDDVLEHVMRRVQLDPARMARLMPTAVERQLMPLIEARFEATALEQSRAMTGMPSGTLQDEVVRSAGFSVIVQVSWNWGFDAPAMVRFEEAGPMHWQLLIELRRSLTLMIEAAWHERTRRLNDLARGVHDPVRAMVLVERVGALEAIVEGLLDGPLVEVAPQAGEE
jgi:hypothetical protein